MTADTEDFLEHYGVKGMKWGKRGASGQLSERQETKQEFKKIRGASQKVVRAKLENKYAKRDSSGNVMTTKNGRVKLQQGKIFAKSMVGLYQNEIAKEVAKSAGYSDGKAKAIALTTGIYGANYARDKRAKELARVTVRQRRNG